MKFEFISIVNDEEVEDQLRSRDELIYELKQEVESLGKEKVSAICENLELKLENEKLKSALALYHKEEGSMITN